MVESITDKEFNIKQLGGIVIVCVVSGALVAFFPAAAPLAFLFLVATLVVGLLMLQRPFYILLLLTALMPFEDFLVKFVPVSGSIQFALRQASEFIIYGTFILLVLRRSSSGRGLRRTPIDFWLLLFIGVSITSMIVNQSPLLGSLINLRAMLRYTVLFYLAANLDFTSRQRQIILKLILGIGAVQILIGVLQRLTRGAINSFLLPPQFTDIELGGVSRGAVLINRGREIGSIFGTLGDTIFLALFLLIVLAVLLGLSRKINWKIILFAPTIFIAINYTFARGVVLASLFIGVIFLMIRYGKNRILLGVFASMPAVVIVIYGLIASSAIYRDFNNPLFEDIGIVDNFTGILTLDYFQRAQNQRLGTLIGIPPTVMANAPLLGYGLDEATTVNLLNESQPSFLLRTVAQNGFEDVYWTAVLAYSGIIGLVAFAMLFVSLIRASNRILLNSPYEEVKQLARIIFSLTIVTLFLLFFYRVVEFRAYSFYYWLLAGLMLSVHFQSHNSQTKPKDN